MPAGRPRKPTWLKILEGNRGRRPIDINSEPQPERAKPRCPKHIQGEARKEWRRKTKELLPIGVLTVADRAPLERYCIWYAVAHEIVSDRTKVAQLSKLFKTKSGYPVFSPLVSLYEKACCQMDKFDTEFGCTAAARTRIKVEQPKAVDRFEAYKKKRA